MLMFNILLGALRGFVDGRSELEAGALRRLREATQRALAQILLERDGEALLHLHEDGLQVLVGGQGDSVRQHRALDLRELLEELAELIARLGVDADPTRLARLAPRVRARLADERHRSLHAASR